VIRVSTGARRGELIAALWIVVGFVAGACTGSPGHARPPVSVEDVACPPEISVQALVPLTCSFVTVPEDRSDAGKGKVRLFVIRIEPVPSATADPIVYVGGAIGSSFDYRNLFDVAATLPGHEVIAIELRGTGHSEPNLSCPEVDALVGRSRAEPVADAKIRRAFVNAVSSCRARIESEGIDPADFDVPESASDVLDVVGALHLSKWEMLSKGSTSRVVFEAMRADPPGLTGVVLENPEFPDTDPFLEAFDSTGASLALLADACHADEMCGSRFPDVPGDVKTAIERLQAHPVVVRDGGQPVWMDGAALLRDLRAQLSSIPGGAGVIGRLPATLSLLARGRHEVRLLTNLAEADDSTQTYCTGYLPICDSSQIVSEGAYYSVLCRDEAPFSDVAATSRRAVTTAWAADYSHGPYAGVCEAWNVHAAAPSVADPISSDVPVYIDSGAFSPFVSPAEVRRGAEGLSNVSTRISTSKGHLGWFRVPETDCLFDVRLAFFDDPARSLDFSCYAGQRLRFSPESI
jgi:pimeloyl-ACP methyl ester carboxylesterase